MTAVIGPPPSSLGRIRQHLLDDPAGVGTGCQDKPRHPCRPGPQCRRELGTFHRLELADPLERIVAAGEDGIVIIAHVGQRDRPLDRPPPQSNSPMALASAPSPSGTMIGKRDARGASNSGKIPSTIEFLGPALRRAADQGAMVCACFAGPLLDRQPGGAPACPRRPSPDPRDRSRRRRYRGTGRSAWPGRRRPGPWPARREQKMNRRIHRLHVGPPGRR